MAAGTATEEGLAAIDWERIARAHLHPLRVDILEVMRLDGGRVLSANEMAFELQCAVPNVHYHATALAKKGFLIAVAHRQARGATEHFYALTDQEGVAELLKRPPFVSE